MGEQALRDRAEAWLADDPDPVTRAELRSLLDRLPDTEAELADRFAGSLRFGTAGLRGRLRAGPNGMNMAVVRAAAAGLISWLAAREAGGPLVIGYDARHRSAEFAAETARVASGAGRQALLLPRPLPTPVLAYAVRTLGAAAGVMVTASHNPPQDNGYKVYLGAALGGASGAGAQLAEPADDEIEAAIHTVQPAQVALGDDGIVLNEEIVDSYLDAVAALVDQDSPRQVTVAYTPLHGVGGEVLSTAMSRAGFSAPTLVSEQSTPDPDFPTVPFPNPEEPGAMDRVVALARAVGADLALANDPDADRCAVAVPGDDGWRVLHGDEMGLLLADHLMRRGVHGRYATTIVSSSALGVLCRAQGLPYSETLTGFKWIVRAGVDLVFGYEEALGYCVAPQLVRDKDGISAALLICELAAELRAQGSSLPQRLAEIASTHGVFVTDQLPLRLTAPAQVDALMAKVRAAPPATLLDQQIMSAADQLPQADVLVWRTGNCRVVIRPSGTEPKLKAYLELAEQPQPDVAAARSRAHERMAALHRELADYLAQFRPS